MESMYDPQNQKIGRSADRDAETDVTMFGYYILNNISIGFRTFAGGIIFGIGWAVSGYCPGTCIVGASEGKKDAVFTVLGALTGAFLFSLAYPFLENLLIKPANFGKVTFETMLGVDGIWLAVPFSAALLFTAFFVLKDNYE